MSGGAVPRRGARGELCVVGGAEAWSGGGERWMEVRLASLCGRAVYACPAGEQAEWEPPSSTASTVSAAEPLHTRLRDDREPTDMTGHTPHPTAHTAAAATNSLATHSLRPD